MFAAQAQAAAVAAAQYYANMSAVSQAQPIPGGMPGGPGLVVTSVAPPPPPTVSNIAFAPAPPAPPILSGTQVLGPQFLVNQPQQPQMHHHIQERYIHKIVELIIRLTNYMDLLYFYHLFIISNLRAENAHLSFVCTPDNKFNQYFLVI